MRSQTTLFAIALLAAACGDDGESTQAGSSTDAGSTTQANPTSGTGSTGLESSSGPDVQDTSSSGGSSTGSGSVDCSDRPTDRPVARGEVEGVWDPVRARMVMFGGDLGIPVECMSQTDFTGQTWAFHPDCDSFEQIDNAGPQPPARGRHATAYDPGRNWMLVHGGRYRAGTSGEYTLFDDTWALDLQTDTWVQVASGGPSARANHTAVVAGDQMIVFGGNASTNGLQFTPLDDLWALDLNRGTWTELQTADGPSARLFHAATVSPDGTTMFVYGGGDESAFTGPFSAELWQLDLRSGAWTLLDDSSATEPLRTIWGDLLFDAPRDQLVLWGAHEDNLLGNANKVWAYDLGGGGWSMQAEGDVLQSDAAGFCDFPADFVAPDLDAPERRSAGATVLTDDGVMLVFGGKTDCGIIDDVWARDIAAGTWDRRVRATTGEICLRAFAEGCRTMCF